MQDVVSESLVRKPEVARRFDTTSSTIDRWVRDGKFPRPVKGPGGQPAWIESELNEHIEKLKKSRQ